jgi:DNA-binding response OmpR family regulator
MGPLSRRVLVVEDDSTLRALFRRRAEHAGLQVLEALASAEGRALAVLEKPDLVLLDLHLPDGSGVGLIQQLKDHPRTSRIPLVVWSGNNAEESEAEVMRAGAAAYFEKRNVKELVAKIVEITQSVT